MRIFKLRNYVCVMNFKLNIYWIVVDLEHNQLHPFPVAR